MNENSIVVHFTTKESLTKIINCGSIKPKNLVYPNATGGDVDKVSAFKNFNYNNEDLIKRIKQIMAVTKNNKYQSGDFVCLLIDINSIENEWEEYPNQINELFLAGLEKIYKSEIGIYIKTQKEIPFRTVVRII